MLGNPRVRAPWALWRRVGLTFCGATAYHQATFTRAGLRARCRRAVIDSTAERWPERRIRAFGEMVDVLAAGGEPVASVR